MDLLDGVPTIIGGYDVDGQRFNDVLYQFHSESREWVPHPEVR
jgi:hypothetical protein